MCHHQVHWADGGPTDLANAALLCERHHTAVHQRRLVGQLRRATDEQGRTTERVAWDTTRGSYDLLLAERRSRRRA